MNSTLAHVVLLVHSAVAFARTVSNDIKGTFCRKRGVVVGAVRLAEGARMQINGGRKCSTYFPSVKALLPPAYIGLDQTPDP